MNVLVACEESQAVCKAFRERGHKAYSCDIQECSGGHPEWHIMGDVLHIINGYRLFWTMDGAEHDDVLNDPWDLIIAHPPCTYLTVAANKLYSVERYGEKAIKRLQDREEAIQFFMAFVNADCEHIAIENPVGVISSRYRKPDCIVQPYQFGHPYRKTTCLWLKNLPVLRPTSIVDFECIHSKGKSGGYSGAAWVVRDENGKVLPYKDPRVAKARSKTFPGIAKAMASQWSDMLTKSP